MLRSTKQKNTAIALYRRWRYIWDQRRQTSWSFFSIYQYQHIVHRPAPDGWYSVPHVRKVWWGTDADRAASRIVIERRGQTTAIGLEKRAQPVSAEWTTAPIFRNQRFSMRQKLSETDGKAWHCLMQIPKNEWTLLIYVPHGTRWYLLKDCLSKGVKTLGHGRHWCRRWLLILVQKQPKMNRIHFWS